MKLAANSEDNPRQIAEKLIQNLTKNDWITKLRLQEQVLKFLFNL